MSDQDQTCPPPYSTTRKLSGFARNHPVLTVLGVGGAALAGGAELAAGVVLGAGLDALLRRHPTRARPQIEPQPEREVEPQVEAHAERQAEAETQPEAQSEPPPEPSEAHPLREKSRAIIARAPHVLRERARAVLNAARGKPTVGSERLEQPGTESVVAAHPVEQPRAGASRIIQSAD